MIPLALERRVFLWRLRPGVAPREAADVGASATLEELVGIIEAAQAAGRARVYLSTGNQILSDTDPDRNEKNQIYVADIRRGAVGGHISMLLNRGDPAAAPSSFLTPASNEVRYPRPKPTEVPGWSAHLVIRTTVVGGIHRCCFEQMSHVPSRLVFQVLDRIVDRSLEGNPYYTYEVTKRVNGKPKIERKRYRPILNGERAPSEKLIDDLEHGSLQGITLTKASTFYAGVGEDHDIRRQLERVVISFGSPSKQKAKMLLSSLLRKAREEKFESVTFDIGDLPGDQSSNPTIPLTDEDALEHLYVRAKRLTGFPVVLATCYGALCNEIVEKMVETVTDDSLW